MAVFEESRVINALHKDKAEVGKKYWVSDTIGLLQEHIENEDLHYVQELADIDICSSFRCFRDADAISWELLHPYEEPPNQRMTNLQFMEWLAKHNGIYKYKNGNGYCYTYKTYEECELNDEVDKYIVIRTWDSDEWVEPTVDIYERDCKGGK